MATGCTANNATRIAAHLAASEQQLDDDMSAAWVSAAVTMRLQARSAATSCLIALLVTATQCVPFAAISTAAAVGRCARLLYENT